MRFFFYGTLIDEDVRHAVLRDLSDEVTVEPASLAGWRCLTVAGRSYPAAVPRASAVTHGVLADGVSDDALVRLVAYEGPEYDIVDCSVETGEGPRTARMFAAGASCRVGRIEWRLEDWQRRHKRRFLSRLRIGRLV